MSFRAASTALCTCSTMPSMVLASSFISASGLSLPLMNGSTSVSAPKTNCSTAGVAEDAASTMVLMSFFFFSTCSLRTDSKALLTEILAAVTARSHFCLVCTIDWASCVHSWCIIGGNLVSLISVARLTHAWENSLISLAKRSDCIFTAGASSAFSASAPSPLPEAASKAATLGSISSMIALISSISSFGLLASSASFSRFSTMPSTRVLPTSMPFSSSSCTLSCCEPISSKF
mmetsp:Transcript_76736/g.194746  ORF Transcript_76736/g.194746 Transcript_76736/m.194746 type:complete len:233 (+) Transcript_76736:1197-1895(+)